MTSVLSAGNNVSPFWRMSLRGFRRVRRDRAWGMTLAVLTALLLLMQLLTVSLLAVEGLSRLLMHRAAVRIEVRQGALQQDIQELFAELRAQPSVSGVEYVTREQALEREKKTDPKLVQFLEDYNLQNPFPDTLAVTLTSLSSYDAFQRFIQEDRWQRVIDPSHVSSLTTQERQIRLIVQAASSARTLTTLFLGLSFLLLFFVIIEWMVQSMRRRSREFLLDRILGAPPLLVLVPVAAEMTLFLCAAFLLAAIFLLGFLVALPTLLPALVTEAPFAAFQEQLLPLLWQVLPVLLAVECILMPFLAFGGAFLGIRSTAGVQVH